MKLLEYFFIELGKSPIESQFNELCLRLSIREVRLAKKMWDTIKLYGVVNAYSAFVYLSLQNNGIDDITVQGLLERLKQNLSDHVNSIIKCSLEYIKKYVSFGSTNDSNKELVLRLVFSDVIMAEFSKKSNIFRYY